MTTRTNQTTKLAGVTDEVARPQPGAAAWPDPVPEQQPWRTPEDAKGWRRIYRGTGQRRRVMNSVVVDLTPDQWTWLNRAAERSGLMLHELLSKLIDEARAAEHAEQAAAQEPGQ